MNRLVSTAALILVFSTAQLRGQEAKTDLDRFQGDWEVTAMESNGKLLPLGKLKGTITFKGDLMTVDGPGFKPSEHQIKLDPSKKPKLLDATPTLEGNGKHSLGIYQIQGDELKLCLPIGPRKERPSEFKSADGSNLVVMTLKRSKK